MLSDDFSACVTNHPG